MFLSVLRQLQRLLPPSNATFKMDPSCPLGIFLVDHERKDFVSGHIINSLLTKLVRSRRLNIGLVMFGSSVHKNAKNNSANIQPDLLFF